METVNIHAAKTHLSKLIERVEKGEEIIISRNGKPLAHLTPHRESVPKQQPRRGGQWTGKIRYAADYDQADAAIRKSFDDSEIFPKDDA
jgi:prevent-host-death family protein